MKITEVRPTLLADGVVEIVHNLGTMDVVTTCFDPNGNVVTPTYLGSVDQDTVEGVFPEEVVRATVTLPMEGEDS